MRGGAWALLALAPAALAVGLLGRVHPDEVYQFLEPAYFRVTGDGLLAWEWQPSAGLRNWAFPMLLASFLRTAFQLGLEHPVAYRAVVALPQVLLHALSLLAVLRYAQRRTEWPTAFAAAALWGLQGAVLLYAGRTLGESFSAALLVVAVQSLDGDDSEERPSAGLAGGLALGFAVVARYASGVMVLAALAWLAGTRRWRTLGWVTLAGSGVVLLLAWLDHATWGAPLHSLVAYVRFNLLEDGAARQFGQAPARFYLWPLVSMTPLWVWPGLLWSVRRERARLPLPLLLAGTYLLVLALTPHKEVRFLYPAVALLSMAACPPVAAWARALSARMRTLALGGLVVLSLLYVAFWPDLRGDQFRAIVRATRDAGSTGLLIVNEGRWGAGGYFYIGKRIPWATCDWPTEQSFVRAMADPRFNRAVTFEGRALSELEAAGFRVTGQIGRETLLAR